MNRRIRNLLVLAPLPLLAACINDAASYHIDGREHTITFAREQPWIWSKTTKLSVVAARLPECQRKHHLESTTASQATAELYRMGSTTYLLAQGERMYLVETRTCEGFQKLDGPPPGGMGPKIGSFRVVDGTLRFVPEEAPAQ